MSLTIYREQDADVGLLRDQCVAILGYGNQGRAHALNLRDSGVHLIVGQRPGRSADQARADGFDPQPLPSAAAQGEVVVLTVPDETAAQVYDSQIAGQLRPGQTLGFVHGFNIHYGFIQPPGDVDVVMVAPKGPGTLLRALFLEDRGLPALFAVHQDASGHAKERALSWAAGIGSARAGVVETTFATETETDLFGEQVVLCGGLTALTKAAFATLVEAGYEPEFAYLECVHELKQIVDLLYERGLTAMRDAISNTAEYGDLTRGPRIVGPETREQMRIILSEIRSGEFAREWIAEYHAGGHSFRNLHASDAKSLFEAAGRSVRSLMPWLAAGQAAATNREERL